MSTITVTLSGICAGGNHLTFIVSGDKSVTVKGMLGEMVEPISEDEAQAFVKVLAKMAKLGRTPTQARTLLQAGVVITV